MVAVFASTYLAFVWRSATTVDGRATFTLFDDAMISMRYARNLSQGNGLVFNAGEQVEGYTNLLWTLVMAGVHVVVPDPRFTSLVVSLIGVVVLVGQLLVVRAAVSRVTDRPWAPLLAVVGVGVAWSLVFWTLRGMEVGLVGLLVTSALVVVHVQTDWPTARRVVVVVLLLGAAVATRDDALVLAGTVAAGALWVVPRPQRLRFTVAAGAALAAAAVARLALRWALYGELVPNTYRLKVQGVPREVLVERGLVSAGYTLAFGLAVLVALAFLAWRSGSFARACILVVVAQGAYSLAVGGDAWEDLGFASRFVATVTAPLVVAAVLGLVALAERTASNPARALAITVLLGTVAWIALAPATTRHHRFGDDSIPASWSRALFLGVAAAAVLLAHRPAWRRPAVAVLAGLIVVGPNLVPWTRWVRSDQPFAREETDWASYGAALREATLPDASIAAASIGNLGYFSDRRIVDLLGKVDPVVAGSRPRTDVWTLPGHLRWDYQHSVVELRPDVVAQLFATDPDDIPSIVAAGYEQLGTGVYLRPGAAITSRAAIERAAAGAG